MFPNKKIKHKKTKLKHNVGVRQLYRRVSKAVTTILDEVVEIEANNISVNNVNISNINNDECSNYNINNDERSNYINNKCSNCNNCSQEENLTYTQNVTSCNLDVENIISDTDLYDSDSSIVTNPVLLSRDNHSPLQNDLSTKLQYWATNYKISHSALSNLLHILSPHFAELPLHSRTLLRTPIHMQSKQLENGEYCHIGLANELKNFLAQNTMFSAEVLKIGFNVDGLPLFRSSNIQFWPILGIVKNTTQNKPFVIGIFCGTSKPIPLEKFLDNFINELVYLLN